MRLLLYPFALLYGLVVVIRRAFYQWGIFKRRAFAKPVICVGNLSVGGTGKSPMVMYLAKLLASQNVATLSRGYGRTTRGFRKVETSNTSQQTGDEPLMFAHELTKAQIFVGENRCNAIDTILGKHPATGVIILDDAYQHMAVQAGLNILITRFDQPFWKDHLLPAGNLREPANGVARAQVVVVTHCPQPLSDKQRADVLQSYLKYHSAPLFFATVKYVIPAAIMSAGVTWKGRYDSLLCVSGIAHPTAFQQQAATYATQTQYLAFADHKEFTEENVKKIRAVFDSLPGEKAILTTAKDRVRMLSSKPCLNMLKEINAVFYQPMELVILDAPNEFDQIILSYAQAHS